MTHPTNQHLSSIVTRLALAVALVATFALPLGYWAVAYKDFSNGLEFKARVKATALEKLIANIPETWLFAENRLQGLLAREPLPLETELVLAYDASGQLLAQAGKPPALPLMRRSYAVYDAARVVGRVEVIDSIRSIVYGTVIASLLGLLLGGAVYLAIRTYPLRALQRLTAALHEEKQRAEVTLKSIGDAVVRTDETGMVEFMNPVAEKLSGWTLDVARRQPITEVLRMRDATTGAPIETTLQRALAGNQFVAFEGETDLVRRDGSTLGIEDSAAPICNTDGKVTGAVLIFRDVSAARDFMRLRSWESAHDVLTGLVNRREFERLVDIAVGSARNEDRHHVVCYMDLDQFKVVNDTCGHAAGDDLLKQLAELLKSKIRKSDALARLGGDEFSLLLDGCSLERAKMITEELLAAVGDFRFTWEGKVFTIGVSIGIATVTQDSISTAETLSMADTACYWAKEQGRNRICVYRSEDSDMALRRREKGWIARINAALSEDRFVLYHQSYKPLNAIAGAQLHLEVLIRMIDEEGNIVQPGSFLPAAERYNLMPAIDRWVVGSVFAAYHGLVAERGGQPLTCAINLSGTSLNAEGFLGFVRQQALVHALPKHSICFEITETAAINNLRNAAEFIRECKAMGFLFALDDFGTGTSSFGYLKNLPVDYLKIDGGFVRNLERDAIDKAMTETINRIGHIMGIKTVAEFAENSSIIQELTSMGVDYAQGYGVCEPRPLFNDRSRQISTTLAA